VSKQADVKVVADGKHIALVQRGKWEFARRKGVSGIVGIVAVTDDGTVEQDRPPVNARVIELPAGLAGDAKGHEGEDLEVAARRELLEETGYAARRMERVAEGVPSAGMTDEVITLFLAKGLTKAGAGEGDGEEDITLHEVPLEEVEPWLRRQQSAGKLIDLKVYAGLYFARRP
jgi:ADP-ribose pyrophosphatase